MIAFDQQALDALETPMEQARKGRRRKPHTPVELSEIQIQCGFRNRLRYVAPAVACVAIPNAAKRTRWAAHQAKKEGLATGFPDVMCIWAGGGICFIEFKTLKGRLSDNQAEWLTRLRNKGHRACVARSVDAALEFLRECGAPMMEAPAHPEPIQRSFYV